MLEENCLNALLGIGIWKQQVATQIHRLFCVGKKVNAFVNVFKLLYGQFIHLGPHAAKLQLISDINFVGMSVGPVRVTLNVKVQDLCLLFVDFLLSCATLVKRVPSFLSQFPQFYTVHSDSQIKKITKKLNLNDNVSLGRIFLNFELPFLEIALWSNIILMIQKNFNGDRVLLVGSISQAGAQHSPSYPMSVRYQPKLSIGRWLPSMCYIIGTGYQPDLRQH